MKHNHISIQGLAFFIFLIAFFPSAVLAEQTSDQLPAVAFRKSTIKMLEAKYAKSENWTHCGSSNGGPKICFKGGIGKKTEQISSEEGTTLCDQRRKEIEDGSNKIKQRHKERGIALKESRKKLFKKAALDQKENAKRKQEFKKRREEKKKIFAKRLNSRKKAQSLRKKQNKSLFAQKTRSRKKLSRTKKRRKSGFSKSKFNK